MVEINELITAVDIDLGLTPASECPALACDGLPPAVPPGISCTVQAVNNTLYGCPQGTLTDLFAMDVHINETPGQQQLDIVASVDHLSGPAVSYVTGCTAMCYPQFLRAITVDVTGPSGSVIIDNCGAPTYCPEGFMSFPAGVSLQQMISVTGSALEQFCNADNPLDGCTTKDLQAGHYSATARFTYRDTPDVRAPEKTISQTVEFDWPQTGSPIPTAEPTATPTPGGTCTSTITGTITATGTRPATLTITATPSPTRTCAAPSPPPVCPPGEGAACEDQQCFIQCTCGTTTPSATPTPSPIPTATATVATCSVPHLS
jgi:hypothetical protein